MSMTVSYLAYLVSSVCCIMALRGLSGPNTAKGGLRFGIAGMALAIVTTLLLKEVQSYGLIILGIAIGGGAGAFIAKKIDAQPLTITTASGYPIK